MLTYQERNELSIREIEQYKSNAVENQKESVGCMKNASSPLAWSIIKKAGFKAIDSIFQELKTLLKETNIDITEPSASSFRILVPERLTPYYMGIRKICICINLETNTNILERLRDRRFILEVSIHDEEENYLGMERKGLY